MFKLKAIRKVEKPDVRERRDPLIFHYGDPVTTRLTKQIEDHKRSLSEWHPLNAPFPSD